MSFEQATVDFDSFESAPESPDVTPSQVSDEGGHSQEVERTESDPSAIFNRRSEQTQTPTQDDDPEFEVPQVGRVRRSELLRGYLRNQDYTRKTQSLQQQMRQAQTWAQEKQAYDATLNEIRGFLQDPARVSAYLASLGGGQQQGVVPPAQPAPQLDPNEIVTARQVQELMQRELQGRLTEQEKKLTMQIRQQQVEAFRTQYSEAVDSKLGEIAQRYPELRQIPGMDKMLREAVRSRQPKSIQEALGLFDRAAQFYSNKFDAIAKARIANQQRTNPVNRGIEPPGGSAPMPKPPVREDQFKGIKDPNFRNAVIADLERVMRDGRV